jgi:hypothetical protein
MGLEQLQCVFHCHRPWAHQKMPRKSGMSAVPLEKVIPVKPERLHQALGVYQMALADKA